MLDVASCVVNPQNSLPLLVVREVENYVETLHALQICPDIQPVARANTHDIDHILPVRIYAYLPGTCLSLIHI